MRADSYVKNYNSNSEYMDQNDIMTSFDVKSLYPSIPVEEALKQIIDTEDIDSQII